MPKSKRGYKVSGGEIYQTIKSSRFLVLDIRADVGARSSSVVRVE